MLAASGKRLDILMRVVTIRIRLDRFRDSGAQSASRILGDQNEIRGAAPKTSRSAGAEEWPLAPRGEGVRKNV